MDFDDLPLKWLCPNDRQLEVRSRLGSGWSTRTIDLDRRTEEGMTEEEKKTVAAVLLRANELERSEQERIGRLVSRLENMRKASFNDASKCVACGENIKSFGKSSLMCASCRKGMCVDCGSSVQDEMTMVEAIVCKLCVEQRELWKKTGAWFYGQLPKYVKTQPASRSKFRSSPSPSYDASREPSDNAPSSSESSSDNDLDYHLLQVPSKNRKQSSDTKKESLFCELQKSNQLSVSSTNVSQLSATSGNSATSVNSAQSFHSLNFDSKPFKDGSEMKRPAAPPKRLSAPLPTANGSSNGHGHSLAIPEGRPRRLSGWKEQLENEKLLIFGSKGTRIEKTADKEEEEENENEDDEDDIDALFEQAGKSVKLDDDESVDIGAGSRFGAVHFAVLYSADESNLYVRINKCTELNMPGHSGPVNSFIKLHLLPGNLMSREIKTGIRTKQNNPVYSDRLVYHGITEEDWKEKTLRLSAYHRGGISHHNQYIGETRIPLRKLQKNKEDQFVRHLEKQPLQPTDETPLANDRGVIQISLQYDTAKKRLLIGILQAAGLPPMDTNGFSDPYVKCYLLPDKSKKTKQKTYVAKKTLNPEFNKEFVYDIELNDLATRVLEVTVWDHDIARHNDYIGGIQLQSKASGLLLTHWYSTLKFPGKRFVYWHRLSPIQPTKSTNDKQVIPMNV